MIHFLIPWDVNDTGVWSGTLQGVSTALQKRTEIKKHCVAKQPKSKAGRIISAFTSPFTSYKNAEKIINSDPEIHDGSPCLAFGEYSSSVVEKTYCYQDLSVDFVIRSLRDKSSGFSYLSPVKRKLWLLNHLVKRKKANRFYRDCAGIFTMSEWLREDMIKNTGIPADKVFSVGGGSNVDASKIDCSKKAGNRFLFVGRNAARKNCGLVIQAFNKLTKAYPSLKPELYIAGPDSVPEGADGNESIHFLGQVSSDELSSYYNLCDYFVMPSKYEAYGLVFAEALIYGLPCIGKNRYAMPEFIKNGENGYLIENDDADELFSAMEKLLVNGEPISRRVRSERLKYIEKYSWDSVADKIFKVINAD